MPTLLELVKYGIQNSIKKCLRSKSKALFYLLINRKLYKAVSAICTTQAHE